MENTQRDFFISYNKADVLWGEWIAWALEDAGYTVNIQAWDFLPGQNFVIGMQQAMAGARHTIAVLSPDYLNAAFTQPEWAGAFAQDPTGEKRTLIPVLVRPCELDGLLRPIIYIDLSTLEEGAACQKLLAGVAEGRAKPKNAPAFPGKKGTGAGPSTVSTSIRSKPAFPKNTLPVKKIIKVFIIAAQKDKALLEEMEKRLFMLKQEGWIDTWNKEMVQPGREIIPEIEAHWQAAQLILPLISADSVSGSYEMIKRAIERHHNGSAYVIPIILRSCLWDFDTLQVLPKDGVAITSKPNRDEAFTEVARGIQGVVKELLTR